MLRCAFKTRFNDLRWPSGNEFTDELWQFGKESRERRSVCGSKDLSLRQGNRFKRRDMHAAHIIARVMRKINSLWESMRTDHSNEIFCKRETKDQDVDDPHQNTTPSDR